MYFMTVSVPYSCFRNFYIGICRSISGFSMIISVLYLVMNKTQIITIAILGGLCIQIFLTANVFLNNGVSFNEMLDSEKLKNKLIHKKNRNNIDLNYIKDFNRNSKTTFLQ